MSEALPPPSLTVRKVPASTHRGSPLPCAGAFRPRPPQRGNHHPAPVKKATSNVAPVLKLLGAIGLAAFSVIYYQSYRKTINDSLKIGTATSLVIEDASNLNLYHVKFTHQGNPGVLLWKCEPGVELVAGPENSLQSLSGHKLRFGELAKTNYVNSDYAVVGLPDDQVPYSTNSHAYNHPEITNLLPVIRR